mmetsp:Transcript_109032/g.170467  ORF Transcript_109032/g.170467 Transcript_109032/m.170467 type:complete len:97 (-) Transcript_109032:5-295(-)
MAMFNPGRRNDRTASGSTQAAPIAESPEDAERSEALDILLEISTLLNTGLDKETLSALVGLCELGVNPEALAEAVKDLQKEARRLRELDASSPGAP